MDIESIVISKNYTDNSIKGIDGVLAGKNCTISKIEQIEGGNRVTFQWTADDGTVKTQSMDVKNGSSESVVYSNPSVGRTVGGVTKGTVFENASIQTVFDKMFEPEYTKPTITLGFSPSRNIYDKVKETLKEITIKANVKKGLEDIANVKFYVNNNLVHTITEGVADGGAFSYTYSFTSPTNQTFSIKVSCEDSITHSVVTSGAGTITFVPVSYYGIFEKGTNTSEDFNATADDIKGLNNTLKNTKTFTYSNFNITYGRVVYAYPSSFGNLSSITSSGFEMFDSFTKEIMTIDNCEYLVYYLADNAGGSNITYEFK